MKILINIILVLIGNYAFASKLLIPMDQSQSNHLKAYGVAFWVLENDLEIKWLLNYRGGSFMLPNAKEIESECVIRGVSYEIIADAQAIAIESEILSPEKNMDLVKLEKVPKIAVYSPEGKQPWDDAVTLVLTYAEIPYEVIYDRQIIQGELPKYDWLHMHHEDFTGQYGRFYGAYRNAGWYQNQVRTSEKEALELGFNKVSELKLGVATKIKEYTAGGGFLFSMCSGTDSYDIALAAEKIDICANMFDGDASDPNAQNKLDYSKTFDFKDFILSANNLEY